MKHLMVIAALLVSGAVHADTVTLGVVADCPNRICSNVPNDAGLEITYLAASGHGRVALGIGTDPIVVWQTPLNVVDLTKQFYTATVYAPDGVTSWVVMATYSSYVTCTHSGRGQSCLTHWSLIGGQIQR